MKIAVDVSPDSLSFWTWFGASRIGAVMTMVIRCCPQTLQVYLNTARPLCVFTNRAELLRKRLLTRAIFVRYGRGQGTGGSFL